MVFYVQKRGFRERPPNSVFVWARLDTDAIYDLKRIKQLARQGIILHKPGLAKKYGLDPKTHFLIPMLDASAPRVSTDMHQRAIQTTDEKGTEVIFKGTGAKLYDYIRFEFNPHDVLQTRRFFGGELRNYALVQAATAQLLHEEFEIALKENDPLVKDLVKRRIAKEAPTLRPIGIFKPLQIPTSAQGSDYIKGLWAPEELKASEALQQKARVVKSATALKNKTTQEIAEQARVFVYDTPVNARIGDFGTYGKTELDYIEKEYQLDKWRKIFSSLGVKINDLPSREEKKQAIRVFASRLALGIHLIRRRNGTYTEETSGFSSLTDGNVTGAGYILDLDTVGTEMKDADARLPQRLDEELAEKAISQFANWTRIGAGYGIDAFHDILNQSKKILEDRKRK